MKEFDALYIERHVNAAADAARRRADLWRRETGQISVRIPEPEVPALPDLNSWDDLS
jgi:hypothetical protein